MKKLFVNTETGKKAHRIIDIIDKSVVVDPTKLTTPTATTPFLDVDIVPWREAYPKIASIPRIKVKETAKKTFINNFINSYITRVKQILSEIKGRIFVPLSSGYDSRLLAWIIATQSDDHDITFFCYGKEIEGASTVAKYLGIPLLHIKPSDNQYADIEYFGFENIHSKIGISNYPYSLWLKFRNDLVKAGQHITDDSILMITQYHNEWFNHYAARSATNTQHLLLKQVMATWYYSQYTSYASMAGLNLVFPIWNEGTIKVLTGQRTQMDGMTMGREIITQADPILGSFPNLAHDQIEREIPKDVFETMIQKYEKSEYAKKYTYGMEQKTNIIISSKWWLHYTTASMTQYLLEKGTDVKFI
jgi:hypothetical protein